jgi:sec-independent protein translocase protein TatA
VPSFVGFPEIILLLVVVLLIFGPKRLPEMGRSLGRGMREFKDSVTGKDDKPDAAEMAELPAVAPPTTPVASQQREHDQVP